MSGNATDGNARINIYGNGTLHANLSIVGGTLGYCFFNISPAAGETKNFDFADANILNVIHVYKLGEGTTNQTGDMSFLGANRPYYFVIQTGTYNSNGYQICCRVFYTLTADVKELNLGSSIIQTHGLDFLGSNLTFDAGTSTIKISAAGITSTGFSFTGAGNTFYDLEIKEADNFTIKGSNTFNSITFSNTTARTAKFEGGTTQTIVDGVFTTNTLTRSLRSYTPGTRYTLTKATGIVATEDLDIQDSIAAGGATWFADSSVDSGNNTGWLFEAPYEFREVEEILAGGSELTLEEETAEFDIEESLVGGGSISVSTQYQALPQKDYEYRVFDSDWNYIATWKNVESEFKYSQSVNEAPTEMTVTIARSPETRKVVLEALKDETGANILDENSDQILVQTETANAVGPDTDVQENFNVEVVAFYGGYDELLDEFGDPIRDETGDSILTSYGNPNGKTVYSGYIGDYELVFGDKSGVKVTIIPHVAEMMHYVFKSGANTTVAYNSVDPVTMARDAMDNYISQGGIITYDTTTMPLSGWTSSYDFKLQTTREVMDKVIELLPAGYYHYVDPGTNVQYLKEKSATAHHTFYYGYHITELRLKKSITQLVNKVYFVGGETAGVYLYKYYEDATSVSDYRPGLERISDSRVTLAASAEVLSESQIEQYKDPRYRTEVTVTDAVYDIEKINLGEMVAFKNFGSFVDDLLLQIVSIDKEKHAITMTLDMVVPGDTKRLAEIKRNILNEQIRNAGSAPS